jgi:hypothetical protein
MSFPVGRVAGEDDLQQELRDLLSLAVVGDHVRWVVTGEGSLELADWLRSAVAQWRAWADEIAKQMVASGVAPDARVRSLATDIPLNWVPQGWLEADAGPQLVGDRLATVADWASYPRSHAGGPRAELLDAICSGLQSQLQARRDIAAIHSQRHATHAANDENSPTTAP